MAFNLVHHFRKYQKFWMATILLVCMVTFVLCTGAQGDLMEYVLRLFGRQSGSVIAKLDGRNLYYNDLQQIKIQRNLANDFMKKACDLQIHKLSEKIKEAQSSTEKGAQEELFEMVNLRRILAERLKKNRYFEGGIKAEDLVDFKLWLIQADRLNIHLEDDGIIYLVNSELYSRQTQFTAYEARIVMRDVRMNYQGATDAFFFRALRDEYRVKIAQLAGFGAQTNAFFTRTGKAALIKFDLGMDIRAPLSPAQMWEFYKQNRAAYDVTLVPVEVDDFIKDLPAPNVDKDLKPLFNEYKDKEYNPYTDQIGFKVPQRVKVEYATADPASPFYRKLSRTVIALQETPLLANPLQLVSTTAARYAVASEYKRASLQRFYDQYLESLAGPARRNFFTSSLTDADFVRPLLAHRAKSPEAVASLVGSLARPDAILAGPNSYFAVLATKDLKNLQPAVREEAKRRALFFASMPAAAALTPFAGPTFWNVQSFLRQDVPLDAVIDDIQDRLEKRYAERWVHKNMAKLKEDLEKPYVVGKPRVKRDAEKAQAEMGLELGGTKEFEDRFSIQQAKGLAPLHESFKKYMSSVNFIEGRTGDRRYKEDDFYRLFFDAGVTKFTVQAWPPVLKIKPNPSIMNNPEEMQNIKDISPHFLQMLHNNPLMFLDPNAQERTFDLFAEAEKPFLFWKTDEQSAKEPQALSEVKDRVEHTFKFLKARDKFALPRAQEIGESLIKSTTGYQPVLTAAAKKLGRDLIPLGGIAPLHPHVVGKSRDYTAYTLPKETIAYARDDMVQQLLSLIDLKKPIETGNKELDALNQKLFDLAKDKPEREGVGKWVQVLTNKPRSVFYVAVVTSAPGPNRDDFRAALKLAFDPRRFNIDGPYDSLVDKSQEDQAKRYRQALLQQLRTEFHWDVPESQERKNFDQDAS